MVKGIAIALLLSGCSAQERLSYERENEAQVQPVIGHEVIAEHLELPWSIAKYGDIIYLTEKKGSIVKIENGLAERQRVELEKPLTSASETGLFGFVLAPDFPVSNLAYAYYTYEESPGQYNRIVTLRLDANVWKEESVLLDRILSGVYHNGGRLEIGPDGMLYATVGDAFESANAQNANLLGGKILRMNLDGSIPSDNPFPNSYVYSYGHRNPQGMDWSPDGSFYATEHGNRANDEVNLIEAAQNYGWPIIEGDEQQEDMVSPLFTSGSDETWAPSGLAYSDNMLYVAALRGSAVIQFDLETGERHEIVSGLGRIRDVFVEDGILYFISNNTDGRGQLQENDDKLYKIKLSS
ncbi:PQQ-dependent sugar dehydrogenase [Paenibacillus sp. IB182493]|uniref:PQQ-dependent sugar dehydrogenase n=1 Tax=Paenibacillus arenilitoris TaxID=2772299 RepID=A0A927CQT1_9BACL|nr:PQQ-dependent sugar dehydrogenase [Paenibacillus arenilitoris]